MNPPITVITGATGFLGTAVLRQFVDAGHRCHVISRDPASARQHLPTAVVAASWEAPLPPGTRNVIHLAGDSVAGIWTRRKRQRILHSRTTTLENLGKKIRSLAVPPRTLVSASAVGYYGDRPGETLTESSAPDPLQRFRFQVCDAWEHSARDAVAGLPTRLVTLRYGNILAPSGGLLLPFINCFRLTGTVVHLGPPSAYKPWISRRDAAALTVFATTANLRGPVNATAPSPSTSSEFYAGLAQHLRVRRHIEIHPRVSRLLMGELVHAFSEDQRVHPARALASGFAFSHPTLGHYFTSLHSPLHP